MFVVVGHNRVFDNISARAVYSTREAAEAYDDWFDDRWTIVELELDAEPATAKDAGKDNPSEATQAT